MKTRLITLLVLGALLHGHAHASPQIRQIGKYYTASIDGSLRGYKVCTPKGYNSKADWKYEVVFLLHGDDTNPDILADWMSKFIQKAEAEKFILVLPQAMYNSAGGALNPSAKPMNPQKPEEGLFNYDEIKNMGGISWSLKDGAQDDHELSYLKRLHSLVSSNFNVDPDRFYLVGHSRGAILAQYAAMKLNAEFAAFASIAGPGAREVGSGRTKIKLASWRPGFRVPILLMNGTRDEKVPYGGHFPPELSRFDGPVLAFANWLGVNSGTIFDGNSLFSKIDTVSEKPVNLSVGRYRTSKDDLNFYAIDGGGHHWHRRNGFVYPGELPPETLCEDIDTTDVVWNFFKNRRKSHNGFISRPD